jgi:UPF0716 family protein affecting phage T7 exclusion
VKTFTKNVLIQLFIGAALVLFAGAIGQGLVLLAFAGVIVGVWVAGKALGWVLERLQRRSSRRSAESSPRHHQEFDDAV